MTLIEEWWGLGERQVTVRKKTGYGGRLESLKMGPFIYSGKTKTQAVWERLLTNQIASLVLTYPLIGRALHVRVRTPRPERIKNSTANDKEYIFHPCSSGREGQLAISQLEYRSSILRQRANGRVPDRRLYSPP